MYCIQARLPNLNIDKYLVLSLNRQILTLSKFPILRYLVYMLYVLLCMYVCIDMHVLLCAVFIFVLFLPGHEYSWRTVRSWKDVSTSG